MAEHEHEHHDQRLCAVSGCWHRLSAEHRRTVSSVSRAPGSTLRLSVEQGAVQLRQSSQLCLGCFEKAAGPDLCAFAYGAGGRPSGQCAGVATAVHGRRVAPLQQLPAFAALEARGHVELRAGAAHCCGDCWAHYQALCSGGSAEAGELPFATPEFAARHGDVCGVRRAPWAAGGGCGGLLAESRRSLAPLLQSQRFHAALHIGAVELLPGAELSCVACFDHAEAEFSETRPHRRDTGGSEAEQMPPGHEVCSAVGCLLPLGADSHRGYAIALLLSGRSEHLKTALRSGTIRLKSFCDLCFRCSERFNATCAFATGMANLGRPAGPCPNGINGAKKRKVRRLLDRPGFVSALESGALQLRQGATGKKKSQCCETCWRAYTRAFVLDRPSARVLSGRPSEVAEPAAASAPPSIAIDFEDDDDDDGETEADDDDDDDVDDDEDEDAGTRPEEMDKENDGAAVRAVPTELFSDSKARQENQRLAATQFGQRQVPGGGTEYHSRRGQQAVLRDINAIDFALQTPHGVAPESPDMGRLIVPAADHQAMSDQVADLKTSLDIYQTSFDAGAVPTAVISSLNQAAHHFADQVAQLDQSDQSGSASRRREPPRLGSPSVSMSRASNRTQAAQQDSRLDQTLLEDMEAKFDVLSSQLAVREQESTEVSRLRAVIRDNQAVDSAHGREKIEHLERQEKSLTNQLHQAHLGISTLEVKLHANDQRLVELHSKDIELGDLRARIRALLSSSEEKDHLAATSTRELVLLRRELENKNHALQIAEETRESHEVVVAALRANSSQLQKQHVLSGQETDDIRNSAAALKASTLALERQLASIQHERDQVTSSLTDELTVTKELLKSDAAASAQASGALQESNRAAQADAESLRSQLAGSSTQLAAAKTEIEHLRSLHAEALASATTQHSQALSDLSTEHDQTLLAIQAESSATLNQTQDRLSAEMKQLLNRYEEADSGLAEALTESHRQTENVKSLTAQLALAERQASKNAALSAQLKDEHHHELTTTKLKHRDSTAKFASQSMRRTKVAESGLVELKALLETSSKAAEQSAATASALTQRLEEKEAELVKCSSDLDSAEKTLVSCQRELSHSQETSSQSQQALAADIADARKTIHDNAASYAADIVAAEVARDAMSDATTKNLEAEAASSAAVSRRNVEVEEALLTALDEMESKDTMLQSSARELQEAAAAAAELKQELAQARDLNTQQGQQCDAAVSSGEQLQSQLVACRIALSQLELSSQAATEELEASLAEARATVDAEVANSVSEAAFAGVLQTKFSAAETRVECLTAELEALRAQLADDVTSASEKLKAAGIAHAAEVTLERVLGIVQVNAMQRENETALQSSADQLSRARVQAKAASEDAQGEIELLWTARNKEKETHANGVSRMQMLREAAVNALQESQSESSKLNEEMTRTRLSTHALIGALEEEKARCAHLSEANHELQVGAKNLESKVANLEELVSFTQQETDALRSEQFSRDDISIRTTDTEEENERRLFETDGEWSKLQAVPVPAATTAAAAPKVSEPAAPPSDDPATTLATPDDSAACTEFAGEAQASPSPSPPSTPRQRRSSSTVPIGGQEEDAISAELQEKLEWRRMRESHVSPDSKVTLESIARERSNAAGRMDPELARALQRRSRVDRVSDSIAQIEERPSALAAELSPDRDLDMQRTQLAESIEHQAEEHLAEVDRSVGAVLDSELSAKMAVRREAAESPRGGEEAQVGWGDSESDDSED